MKLKDYIESYGIAVSRFAKISGVSIGTLRKLIHSDGSKDVAISVGLKIEKATDCRVKCEDLISEELLKVEPEQEEIEDNSGLVD